MAVNSRAVSCSGEFLRHWVVVLGLLALGASAASAKTIAFFDNPSYTDPSRESPNLAASLVANGHTINTFSGIAAADWQQATQTSDLLVIPELDANNLFPDLSADARQVIAGYVQGGGCLITIDRAGRTGELLNGLFGFSLSVGTSEVPSSRNDIAAAGTPFAGGPATLPGADATEFFTTASLPAGALDLYRNTDSGDTSVFAVDVGSGRVQYLGFDWFEEPTPPEWAAVVGLAVLYCPARAAAAAPALDKIGMLMLVVTLAAIGWWSSSRSGVLCQS